jgi:hypothetical protein
MLQRQAVTNVAVDSDSSDEESTIEEDNENSISVAIYSSQATQNPLTNNDDDNDVAAIDLHSILERINDPLFQDETEYENSDTPQLPPHFRCVCHTLNLIASNDVNKGLKSTPTLSKMSTHLHETLSKVWKKQGKSGKVMEMIHDAFGKKLVTPVKTRLVNMNLCMTSLPV